MNNKSAENYYGSNDIRLLSYLEFGSIDLEKSKKEIWGYYQHQKAYDYYMFSRYANDLFLFRDFYKEDKKDIYLLNEYILKSAHTKLMDYIFKYAGIITLINNKLKGGICESGSSLFGLIDEVIACDYVYNAGNNINSINRLKYIGSDISDMMNRGAEAFHNNCNFSFSTADTINKLLDEVEKLALFYGLSVSLRYALRTTDDILKIAKKSELSIFNRISLSYKETIKSTVGTGKYVYIISLPEFVKIMKKNGYIAKYCTANMQYNRDGNDTVRASIIISQSEHIINQFIENYENYIEQSISINEVVKGKWKELEHLLKAKV